MGANAEADTTMTARTATDFIFSGSMRESYLALCARRGVHRAVMCAGRGVSALDGTSDFEPRSSHRWCRRTR